MSLDLLLALVAFAFVTSEARGPNNLMLLASGVNFGFDRTLPHMFGVGLGFTFMICVIGLGLGQLETPFLCLGNQEIAEDGYPLRLLEFFRIDKVSIEFRRLDGKVDLHQA